MKLLIDKKGKRKIFPENIDKDLHTHHGVIKKEVFNKTREGRIKTHNGEELLVLNPNFKDLFDNIRRGPQIITLKDAGFIASQLGISKDSKVLDCGGGSGAMTYFLANTAKKVISVEKKKKFAELIKKNIKMFGFRNVEVINKDIKEGIKEKGFDAINLDLPYPEKKLSVIIESLKTGGMLSIYLPNMTQVINFLKKAEKYESLKKISVNELVRRRWKTGKGIMRPKKTIPTGFIIILRKIQQN